MWFGRIYRATLFFYKVITFQLLPIFVNKFIKAVHWTGQINYQLIDTPEKFCVNCHLLENLEAFLFEYLPWLTRCISLDKTSWFTSCFVFNILICYFHRLLNGTRSGQLGVFCTTSCHNIKKSPIFIHLKIHLFSQILRLKNYRHHRFIPHNLC